MPVDPSSSPVGVSFQSSNPSGCRVVLSLHSTAGASLLRVVALLGPYARPDLVRRFEASGVDIFSGNDLDPSDRPNAALIFGGDGTVHRHLPALIESKTPFLHVPCGSANDFAASLDLHTVKDAMRAWQRFAASGDNVRTLDAGSITPLHARSESIAAHRTSFPQHVSELGRKIIDSQLHHLADRQEHAAAQPIYFCCVAGAGLDSEATRIANRLPRWLRQHGGYILAAGRALFSYKPQSIRLSTPAPAVTPTPQGWLHRVDEPALMVAIGNAPRYGSGMRMTHRARMDDGLLDACFVRTIGKLKIIRLFPTVFRGAHLHLKEVEYFQTDRVRLESALPMPVYADGERICDTPVEIAVLPGALRAIVR